MKFDVNEIYILLPPASFILPKNWKKNLENIQKTKLVINIKSENGQFTKFDSGGTNIALKAKERQNIEI